MIWQFCLYVVITDFPSVEERKREETSGFLLRNLKGFVSPMTVTRLPKLSVGRFEYQGD